MSRPKTPEQAWLALRQGNERFMAGTSGHSGQRFPGPSPEPTPQSPFALVLGCIDSRVPPELVFDQGIGDLAVVRVAGKVLDSAGLGSLEFGVSVLGASLVVVLGHSDCGAMRSALALQRGQERPTGYIRTLVDRITPSYGEVRRSGTPAEEISAEMLTDAHVRRTVRLLVEWSPVLAQHVAQGTCALMGARYRMTDGRVDLLECVGDIGDAGAP